MIQVPDEIKALLHQDTCKKNIRIHFPNDERADICNGLIVKDSVSFTESLCSQNTLKFGLCEASIFECETVGVGNIKGAVIEVSCEIYCESTVTGAEWRSDLEAYVYAVPYGTFIVNSCQRQADIIHRKIVAYGGTASLKSTNPIILAKNACFEFSTQVAYSPDIFSSIMMISNSRTPLPGTDLYPVTLTTDEIGVTISWYEAYDTRYSLILECVGYAIDDSTADDKLYYVEVPDLLKTKDAIANDLFSNILPEYKVNFFSAFDNAKLFGTGIGVYSQGLLPAMVGRYALQNGMYLYPYQFDAIVGTVKPILLVPHTIKIVRQSLGGSLYVVSSSVYRDKSAITINEVDTTDYPHFRGYAPRDIPIDLHTPTAYCYDPSKIDYVQLMVAALELQGEFGNLNHKNEFVLLNIKQQFALLPEMTLYPSGTLYPEGVTGGEIIPNDYQSCWYDDEYTKPFGAIHCIYTDSNEVQNDFTYYLTGYSSSTPTDDYLVYELSENAIIQMYMWTQAQIQDICETIESNIEGVTYMPVDFVGRGLPYVEAGDTFEVLTKLNDSITTIVLNRTLTGDQTLKDEYKSTGIEEGGVM